MPRARRTAALLAAAVLVVPAGALAQSDGAGDEQYQDPFEGQTPTQTAPTPQHEALGQAPPSSGGSGAGAGEAAGQQAAPAAGSGGELPRTGFDVWPLAAGGVLLLGAGLALWRRAD